MIYLPISILVTTTLSLMLKSFKNFKINNFNAIVFNYLSASILSYLIICLERNISFFNLDYILNLIKQKWILLSFIIGIYFISLFNFIAYCLQSIGFSKTTVSSKMSLAIPSLFGIIFLNDSINILKIIGIFLSLLSIILISNSSLSLNSKFSKNNLFFLLLLFLFSGFLDILLIYSLEKYKLVEKNILFDFFFVVFSTSAILGLSIILFSRNFFGTVNFKSTLAGFSLGIPNVLSIYVFFECLDFFSDSSFIFPVHNISILCLSVILGYLFFNEKLNNFNIIGIVVSITSLLILFISKFY